MVTQIVLVAIIHIFGVCYIFKRCDDYPERLVITILSLLDIDPIVCLISLNLELLQFICEVWQEGTLTKLALLAEIAYYGLSE